MQLIILVTLSLASSRVIDRCSEWYISSEGNKCTYCPPGTYKYQDCTQNGESAICKGCGYEYYQTFCNRALSCAPCSQVCPWRFSQITEACTMYSDVKCTCEQGKYLLKETSEDGVCLNHNQCYKGYGLVEPGTPLTDTVCESCLEGKTFSDVASLQHCKPCKLCVAFRQNCSTIQDAECGDKTPSDNPDNIPNKTANNNDEYSTKQNTGCADKPSPDNTDNELDTNSTHVIERVVYQVIIIVLAIVLAVLSSFLYKKTSGNSRRNRNDQNPQESLLLAEEKNQSTRTEKLPPEDSPKTQKPPEEKGGHMEASNEKNESINHGNQNRTCKESRNYKPNLPKLSKSTSPVRST